MAKSTTISVYSLLICLICGKPDQSLNISSASCSLKSFPLAASICRKKANPIVESPNGPLERRNSVKKAVLEAG